VRIAVFHADRYADDRDGDGHCKVHVKMMEGVWTSLRKRLRRFREMHKKYPDKYVAVFHMVHNVKAVCAAVIRRMCGYPLQS
jgi:hypothetical protein